MTGSPTSVISLSLAATHWLRVSLALLLGPDEKLRFWSGR